MLPSLYVSQPSLFLLAPRLFLPLYSNVKKYNRTVFVCVDLSAFVSGLGKCVFVGLGWAGFL